MTVALLLRHFAIMRLKRRALRSVASCKPVMCHRRFVPKQSHLLVCIYSMAVDHHVAKESQCKLHRA